MAGKYILSAILSAVIFFASSVSASAFEIPNFTMCANPQGEVIASYNSGTHGVPGDQTTYSGFDTVYSVSENANTQCLCTDQGQGIQTNWLNASGASDEEIDVLTSQGWILIPDGSAWGLNQGPYLAQNSSYTCVGSLGVSATNTQIGEIGGPTGEASTIDSILNLASTGNIRFILLTLVLGTGLVVLGFVPHIKKRN